jgi:gluconokinase
VVSRSLLTATHLLAAKMSSGVPLEDADRWPWLDALALVVSKHRATGEAAVLSCSALRRVYRERLMGGAHAYEDISQSDVRFVHLSVAPAVLAARLAARTSHFMPPALLQSQLDTLELDDSLLQLDAEASAEAMLCELRALVASQ